MPYHMELNLCPALFFLFELWRLGIFLLLRCPVHGSAREARLALAPSPGRNRVSKPTESSAEPIVSGICVLDDFISCQTSQSELSGSSGLIAPASRGEHGIGPLGCQSLHY